MPVFAKIDPAVTPPVMTPILGLGAFSGDMASDPLMRSVPPGFPVQELSGSMGNPNIPSLEGINRVVGGATVFHGWFTYPSGPGVFNPIEGLAYTHAGAFWASEYVPPAGPDIVWRVASPTNAGLSQPLPIPEGRITDLASEPQYCVEPQWPVPHPAMADHGDAPDSSNHSPYSMSAYLGVQAHFPTVSDSNNGIPVGPKHRSMSDALLGSAWNPEVDADVLGVNDPDPIPNIDPWSDSADQDGGDDGFVLPFDLPHCRMTTVGLTSTVLGAFKTRFLTVWFDFNRDGDWADTLACMDPAYLFSPGLT